jgi:hypothetical protein
LPAKSLAYSVDPQGSLINVYTNGHTKAQEPTPHGGAVPSGTRVLTLEDDEIHSANAGRRMVEVRITGGERREPVGFVPRSKLRPRPAE